MFAGARLLLIACVAALAHAQTNNVCVDQTTGSLNGREIKGTKVTINSLDGLVTMPYVCHKIKAKHIGTKVRVCDNTPASIYFTDLDNAQVHRNGSPFPPADVYAFVYCDTSSVGDVDVWPAFLGKHVREHRLP